MTRRGLLLALLALPLAAHAKRANPMFPIVGIVEAGGATIVTIGDAGLDKGITRHWRARFVTRDGRVDNDTDLAIIRIDRRRIVAKTKRRLDEVQTNYDRVVFDPP